MDREKFIIDYPLVDKNFNPVSPASENFLEKTQDEFTKYEVTLKVHSLEMGPTAMFFSLKPIINIDFYVDIDDFPGSNFIESFLYQGHIKEIYHGR